MNFLELAEVLNSCPKLSAGLSFDDVVKYVDITRLLKPTISLMEASYHLDPPEYLTVATHEFLKVCLNISDETAKLAWATLRKLAWSFEATKLEVDAMRQKYAILFLEHGIPRGISKSSIVFADC